VNAINRNSAALRAEEAQEISDRGVTLLREYATPAALMEQSLRGRCCWRFTPTRSLIREKISSANCVHDLIR